MYNYIQTVTYNFVIVQQKMFSESFFNAYQTKGIANVHDNPVCVDVRSCVCERVLWTIGNIFAIKNRRISFTFCGRTMSFYDKKSSPTESCSFEHIYTMISSTLTHTCRPKEEKRKEEEKRSNTEWWFDCAYMRKANTEHICRYLQLFEKWIDPTKTARNQIAKWMLIESISHLNDDAITDKWYSYRTQCLGNHKN